MSEFRRKQLVINVDFLPALLGEHGQLHQVTKDPLPDDSRVIGCRMDDPHRNFILVIESQEFEPVSDGCPLPEILPIITQSRS